MERTAKMAALAEDFLYAKFDEDTEQIMLMLECSGMQMIEKLRETLEKVLGLAAERQKEGEKDRIAYISFSLLKSDLLLNRYSLRVDAWDERFLLDESEASGDWDFHLMLQRVSADFSEMARVIRRKMTRVQQYELAQLERLYRLNYYAFSIVLLQTILPLCLAELGRGSVALADEVQFTVGAYMEQQTIFYQWRTGG